MCGPVCVCHVIVSCSATLTLYGGRLVPYLLDESKGWGLDIEHLKEQLATARAQGTNVRGLVVSRDEYNTRFLQLKEQARAARAEQSSTGVAASSHPS